MIGNFGRAEVLSFHATKFFNTFEGGAVVTNDSKLADRIRLMRNFGFVGLDNVIHPGTNGKMVEVCAAMGIANLSSIDVVLDANRRNYYAYKKGLAELKGVQLLSYDERELNNFQYIVVEITPECRVTRDEIVGSLNAQNVLARKYFWPGCHRMKPYRDLFPDAGLLLPVTELIASQVLVLPTGTTLGVHQIEIVVQMIRELVS